MFYESFRSPFARFRRTKLRNADGAAPEATALFLKIALDGGYHSGKFHRAVRDTKEPANGYIGAKVNALWLERAAKRLQLEGVPASKTPPADSTIAWARAGENTGAFVIFVGQVPQRPGDVVPSAVWSRGIMCCGRSLRVRLTVRH